ncbi:mandelate racemase/muconate lactonizing enzyme family protein [Pararhizobium haloflavum]|uniref:mandelate racemase/muconate lactonizing enzyme family protein n=1 Tax=Pararhizobium haloflavum TaxID=2037914 RepID=UPI000C187645|nr:mandelate racemase/muconate lactonizing enzyme family protein [Pararhizobium haloflavum]
MKIVSVATHVLRHQLEQAFDSAFSTFHDRWACLVEIGTDAGVVGWGECLGPAGPNAALVEAMAGRLIGRDPLDIEPIWADIYNQFRDQGQRGATMTAQSGIDIALWDIAGKHFGAPIHRLLGGAHRTSIPAYATGGFRPVGRDRVATVVEEVKGYMAAGFSATKIKIGFSVADDLALIAAVREAIGPGARLMIDANHGYDAIEAIALGNKAAHFDIDWFEEPVVPETLDAYCDVRARQPLPVAGGETWHGRLAFTQAIEKRAVDILQPDVCGCGGITEMKKIFALAETAGVRVVPHVWGTGVALAASLHMLAVLPPAPLRHGARSPWLEFDQTHNPYRQAILSTPIVQKGGRVAVPLKPGLGIDIVPEIVAQYRVGGSTSE